MGHYKKHERTTIKHRFWCNLWKDYKGCLENFPYNADFQGIYRILCYY